MKNIEVIFQKRIAVYTKATLSLFIISCIIFLNYLDLKKSNRSRVFLELIRDVEYRSHADLRFQKFELSRIDWLKKNMPVAAEKHIAARLALVRILNNYGAGIGAAAKGGNNNPNTIILMGTDSLDREFAKQGFSASHNYNNDDAPSHELTIREGIDVFNRYAASVSSRILIDIDTSQLIKKLEKIKAAIKKDKELNSMSPSSSGFPRTGTYDDGPGGPSSTSLALPPGNVSAPANKKTTADMTVFSNIPLNYLYLQHSKLFIDANTNNSNNAGQGNDGKGIYHQHFSVPAQFADIIFPTTLLFSGFDTATVKQLYRDTDRQQELKDLYGFYKLTDVEAISSKAIEKNSDNISILGFDISRHWFPLVIMLVILMVNWRIMVTIKRAQKNELNFLAQDSSDDSLSFLTENKPFRFFMWVIIPIVMLLLIDYSTLIAYHPLIKSFLLVTTLLSSLFGLLSFVSSYRLEN